MESNTINKSTSFSKNVHGGNLQAISEKYNLGSQEVKELVDFSVNINPLGFPDWLRGLILEKIGELKNYPDLECQVLRKKIAEYLLSNEGTKLSGTEFHVGTPGTLNTPGILVNGIHIRPTSLSLENVVVTNGASEFFYHLPSVLAVKEAIIPIPSFSCYQESCQVNKIKVDTLPLLSKEEFNLDYLTLQKKLKLKKESLVYLGHPNNPTAGLLDISETLQLVSDFPQTFFVIDEAFIDFIDPSYSFIKYQIKYNFPNLIISRSLTKILAIPGLRLAYAILPADIATKLNNVLPPWNVNHLAQAVGTKLLEDNDYFPDFIKKSYQYINTERTYLSNALNSISGIKVFNGHGNFLLLKIYFSAKDSVNQNFSGNEAQTIVSKLLTKHKIVVRDASNFPGIVNTENSGDIYLRVAVKDRKSNEKLIAAFHLELGVESFSFVKKDPKNASSCAVSRVQRPRRAPALMLLGTSSSAGKSLLATAFCRIFHQDGIKVAPFKAQNMALNSYVTPLGEEIGRAQVVQAQAAEMELDVRINPVLLKPSSEQGSQVVVNGKALGNFGFNEYSKMKAQIFKQVQAAYDSLASEYELIILEGAGSISEVNLKANDIVNMNMARHAGAHGILVGDIDRGGVFGSLIGSILTLEEWERNLIKGMIINQFRGIKELMYNESGIKYLEKVTEKKVIGIVPYIKNLNIPGEDSLNWKKNGDKLPQLIDTKDTIDIIENHNSHKEKEKVVEIAVLSPPFISNFTDLDPFMRMPNVRLKSIHRLSDLSDMDPDIIILPGSKNVISDLEYLHEQGLIAKVLEWSKNSRKQIIGICGGYQMLGMKIIDPHGIESPLEEVEGIGLLPIITIFKKDKILKQVKARVLIHNSHGNTPMMVGGYEIHHGESVKINSGPQRAFPFVIKEKFEGTGKNLEARNESFQEVIGYINSEKNVWGSYLHGIFDEECFRNTIINQVLAIKNAPLLEVGLPGRENYQLKESFDLLAKVVRESVDMNYIYSLFNF